MTKRIEKVFAFVLWTAIITAGLFGIFG